jgi:thiol-disulfide isomerase/thioredoxin
VIEFYDDSCAPCRALEPVYEQVSQEYADRVDFFAVDITREEQLARELGIEHLPTLVFCPLVGGPIVMAGMATRERLTDAIERRLLATPAAGA